MTNTLRNMLAVLLALVCGTVEAQQETTHLPDVLIIGDSIYHQHARGASAELKDDANVQFAVWPQGVLPNSTNAIEHLDLLLGLKDVAGNEAPEGKRPTWDVVYFNCGLGDLIYCVPNIKSHRVLPYDAGGVIRTDTQQYEKNLDTLVRLLRQKAPHAKLIWASTTPIRHSRENVFKLGTEIEYNAIAARVMKKHDIPTNDIYTFAKGLIDMDKPAGHGVDPFFFDRKPLHPPIVGSIRSALDMPPTSSQ